MLERIHLWFDLEGVAWTMVKSLDSEKWPFPFRELKKKKFHFSFMKSCFRNSDWLKNGYLQKWNLKESYFQT